MITTAKWYSGTLTFLTFVLQMRKYPEKNLAQETCPDRGSNPGPLRDKRACYHFLHSGGQPKHCYGDWVASHEQLRSVLVHFPAKLCSRGSINHMQHDDLLQENLPQASHFFYLLILSDFLVVVYAHATSTRTISPARNCTMLYCELTTDSLKALWISVGYLSRKVSIIMYDVWSEIATVPDTPAGSISSSC